MYCLLFARRNLLPPVLLLALIGWGREGQAQGKKKELAPQEITRETKDGVEISATYFPSDAGKDAVPVMMIHDWGRTRADYRELALTLWKEGHAVLLPDLRGHGRSTKVKGSDSELKYSRMRKNYHCRMTYAPDGDLEVCKRFLIQENNAGRINIEKLCVVGSGFGALVAMNWSVTDYAWPKIPVYKQGRDVKGLVLLSPPLSDNTLNGTTATNLKKVAPDLSTFILVGKSNRSARRDAERIHKLMSPLYNTNTKDPNRDLFYAELATSRQGTEMLALRDLNIPGRVSAFVNRRLKEQNFAWKERKNPLKGN